MLYFSLFLAGFTLGIFAALKIFAPENQEEVWDPQHLPAQAGFPADKKLSSKASLVLDEEAKTTSPISKSVKPSLTTAKS